MSAQGPTEDLASDNCESFPAHAERTIRTLRQAVGEIARALPGARIRRPNDLANVLGIDPKLAWRVSRVIQCTDPFGAALHVPGRAGMRILIDAAARHGAPPDVLNAAEQAYDQFSELVHVHGGDRRTFDMLISGYVKQDRRRGELHHRKLMFQGMSYVWGVQVRVQAVTTSSLRPRTRRAWTRRSSRATSISAGSGLMYPGGLRGRIGPTRKGRWRRR